MIKNLILVGTGGFIGSVARYYLSLIVTKIFPLTFPVGTFTVNILGSFLIGLIYETTEQYPPLVGARLFLATGFCGGFTTFSALSLESLSLLEKNEYLLFIGYVLSSIIIGIISVVLGIQVGKWLG
ncbi:MAG: fluoride efflux transporter CrcB [Bacteroidia bacterium]